MPRCGGSRQSFHNCRVIAYSSTSRATSRRNLLAASVSPDRPPCFQALRLPLGGPLPFPPCIRQRFAPLIAGDLHNVPIRVIARHLRAAASRAGSGCMGLFGGVCISVPPGVMVELIGNDGLPAFVHVHMAHDLLARLVKLRQLSPAISQRPASARDSN